MRLIDKDELIYMEIGEGEKAFRFVPTEFIEDAPTVEAIPIDWLKKKYFNKRTIYSDRSLARQMAVKELIKEWEDESRTGD